MGQMWIDRLEPLDVDEAEVGLNQLNYWRQMEAYLPVKLVGFTSLNDARFVVEKNGTDKLVQVQKPMFDRLLETLQNGNTLSKMDIGTVFAF